MILGTVRGTVYSTRKMDNLKGLKFLMVQPQGGSRKDMFVAADIIGAGVGELVLVTTDQTTQYGLDYAAPIDALVVGIVDNPPAME